MLSEGLALAPRDGVGELATVGDTWPEAVKMRPEPTVRIASDSPT